MPLPLDDLGLLDAPAASAGQPLQLPIESIDEDPDQPRQEFDAESLRELATTIAERGVRSPISVRPHPEAPGRWILNFGARRLRASKLAGRADIPAFVDRAADAYDQVIENEQREGLTPLELALFVQRRLATGESQVEIARHIGKSKMYVTYATALIDAPDWLLEMYRQGRCRGLRELHELRRLDGEHPARVQSWLADRESITRSSVDALRKSLKSSAVDAAEPSASTKAQEQIAYLASTAPTAQSIPPDGSGPNQVKRTHSRQLCANLEGDIVVILAHSVPPENGQVFVAPLGAREQTCVAASRLRLLGFLEITAE